MTFVMKDFYFQSLDYDVLVNPVTQDAERTHNLYYYTKKYFLRWVIVMFIGILTGLVACGIDISIETITNYKFAALQNITDRCVEQNCPAYAYLTWAAMNMAGVFIAVILGSVIEVSFKFTNLSPCLLYLFLSGCFCW